ncbi:unnamed protein product [Cuscuta campestris]|uniref:Uncharacterized protein n=1 Tax=Cuscuta campestris TaxID=132261 RepID=A0A484LAD7_9ASTE|nr:unnamed protein product [Cuscuta campestris]
MSPEPAVAAAWPLLYSRVFPPFSMVILCSIYSRSFSSRWQLIVTKLMEPNVGVLNASPVYARSVDDDGVVDSFSLCRA